MKYLIVFFVLFIIFSSCTNSAKLTPPDLVNDSVKSSDIVLTPANRNIPADSLTYDQFVIKVSSNVLANYKQVTFDISPVGKFTDGSTVKNVSIDASGNAYAFVFSSTPGIATVRATIGNLVRTSSIVFTPKIDTVTISVLNNYTLADNTSYAEVIAQSKDPNIILTMKSITFTADRGTFSNNQQTYTTNVILDSSIKPYVIAKAYLKDNKVENVRVRASVSNNYLIDTIVTFTPAWPSLIIINPGVSILRDTFTSQTTVTAKLSRSSGSVSIGQIVHFYDSSSLGINKIGTFLSTSALADTISGIASSQYWITDTTHFKGFVYIVGTVDTGSTTKLMGYNQILIR